MPGWYPDGQGAQRWWDGQVWTEHVQPQPGAVPQQQFAAPVYVNNAPGKFYKTSHGLHLFLTIITFGLWGFVWIGVGLYNASRNGR